MRRAAAALVLLLGVAACHDGGSSADAKEFCRRLDRLTNNDPFTAFGPSATDAEIKAAFHALVERADELDEVAPDDAKGAAHDFADSAHDLEQVMADAGYDGAEVDTRAYRDAQTTYSEASSRLLNYLDASC